MTRMKTVKNRGRRGLVGDRGSFAKSFFGIEKPTRSRGPLVIVQFPFSKFQTTLSISPLSIPLEFSSKVWIDNVDTWWQLLVYLVEEVSD